MTSLAVMAHPTLYESDPHGEPVILGQRCQACAHVMFPRQAYGCEICGAHGAALEPMDLGVDGELVAFAQVHRHRGKGLDGPFVMGEIRLGSGPFFRCTLEQRDVTGLQVGDRVRGVLVRNDEAGEAPVLELRFRQAKA